MSKTNFKDQDIKCFEEVEEETINKQDMHKWKRSHTMKLEICFHLTKYRAEQVAHNPLMDLLQGGSYT